MKFAYIAAFATALFYGISAVIEDRAAKLVPVTGRGGKRAAVKATVSKQYLVGMALSVVAWAFSVIALHTLPLFAVQAISAGSIGVVVLILWAITRQRPSRRQALLLLALAAGLVALAVSAEPSRPHHSHWLFRVMTWIGVAAVALAAWRATRHVGTRGCALLGTVSGLADGGMALCARAVHRHPHHLFRIFSDPLLWAMIPLAVIGVITFAAALQRGPASIALACQQGVLTIVPSAIGLIVLGDRARPGFIPLTYAGFLVTLAAVIALTLKSSHDSSSVPEPQVSTT